MTDSPEGQARVEGVDVLGAHGRLDEASTHLGVDDARRHHVDVDAVVSFFFGQRERQRFERGLAHVVRGTVGAVELGRDTRDHHDVPALERAHGGDHEATEVVGTDGVDSDDAADLFGF